MIQKQRDAARVETGGDGVDGARFGGAATDASVVGAVRGGRSGSSVVPWGSVCVDGVCVDVHAFELWTASGCSARFVEVGAALVSLSVPDRDGVFDDVTLGYDEAGRYVDDSWYFGAVVGRCANRIEGGRFELAGRSYQLPTNDGEHHLHGGRVGFDTRAWAGELVDDPRGPSVRFSRVSPDGEEGYPGTLSVSVSYTLTGDGELITEMTATTDAPTLCGLVQHAYWNLSGHASGSIAGHELVIEADRYTPSGPKRVPTGEVVGVEGTPLDFRVAKPIGPELARVGADPTGLDHNFEVRGEPTALRPVARLYDPASGRVMRVLANQPGVQVYSGNFLDGVAGKGGATYGRYAGICLETQTFPNAVNQPGWVSPVLRPGETYRHVMVMGFSTDADAGE